MRSAFGTGWSAKLTRDLFMSEHLSEPFIEKHPYQLSYVMLIERSINLSLIVYVDAIVNQAEYQ